MAIFDAISDHYDEYMDDNGLSRIVEAQIHNVLMGRKIGKVLDVGIGTGKHIYPYYSHHASSVKGVEPSSGMLKGLRKRFQNNMPDIINKPVEEADLRRFEFNTAVLTLVLNWVNDYRAVLAQVATEEPAYILITNQILTPEETAKRKAIKGLFASYTRIRQDELIKIMGMFNYFPINVTSNINGSTYSDEHGEVVTTLFSHGPYTFTRAGKHAV